MKKYAHLYPPLLDRITAEESAKKDAEKDIDKAVKTRLHQLYGAYVQPAAFKKTGKLLDTWEADTADKLLRLHASTRERLLHYSAFYHFIFAHADPPASILDVGCGFNPFSLPYIYEATHHRPLQIYRAYDIDIQQAALLNRFFTLHSLPAAAECADLAVQAPPHEADIAFMFKLMPVLEAQSSGSGYRLARQMKARFLVITYPLKSLSGKEKGMAANYRNAFLSALEAGRLCPFVLVADRQIGTEWVCLLENANSPLSSPVSM